MPPQRPFSYHPSTVHHASLGRSANAIVAIPAHDEADRIGACLAALALQRDGAGAPLSAGSFDVLILANNCSDRTAEIARGLSDTVPFRLEVIECRLPPEAAHAGGARKAALDHAADRIEAGWPNGVLLTTDADSRVQPTWVSETLSALSEGVDAVAGYIDADPAELVALGPGFLRRGRLEDRFLSRVAETYAILDPRRHDPWPNHRVHSGASLAVTVEAYRAIGGLPARPLGEDAALARSLEGFGFLIRHSLSVSVLTSCRFDSRAAGGAGDTMRLRHENPDADCDQDLEPIDRLFRRARARGLLRRLHEAGRLGDGTAWRRRLGIDRLSASKLVRDGADRPFIHLWEAVERESPILNRRTVLKPSDLARETTRADRMLARLRALMTARSSDQADIPGPAAKPTPAAAVSWP